MQNSLSLSMIKILRLLPHHLRQQRALGKRTKVVCSWHSNFRVELMLRLQGHSHSLSILILKVLMMLLLLMVHGIHKLRVLGRQLIVEVLLSELLVKLIAKHLKKVYDYYGQMKWKQAADVKDYDFKVFKVFKNILILNYL